MVAKRSYGCVWGKTCSCDYDRSDEKDACYNGCTNTFTGSVKVDVKNVTDLEKTYFLDVEIPFAEETPALSLSTGVKLPGGATSDIYWKLCQSGICVSDTTPVSSSTVQLSARCTIYTKACSNSDQVALYLTIDQFDIIEPGLWNVEDLIGDVAGAVGDSMDWLADNIDDVFKNDLEDDFWDAYESTLAAIEEGMNAMLADIPIIACPTDG